MSVEKVPVKLSAVKLDCSLGPKKVAIVERWLLEEVQLSYHNLSYIREGADQEQSLWMHHKHDVTKA